MVRTFLPPPPNLCGKKDTCLYYIIRLIVLNEESYGAPSKDKFLYTIKIENMLILDAQAGQCSGCNIVI